MVEGSEDTFSSDLIYHVTTKAEWTHAQLTGTYDRSTKGKSFADVGFIHASTAIQLEETKNFVYGPTAQDLVVLVISQAALTREGIEVRFEDGGAGEFYPHIYGPIPVRLIKDTINL
jgi:uncharacterized protein (DUF952 family)